MKNLQSIKILVVDDDSFILQLVEETFRMEKATVSTADNGYEALQAFNSDKPQLVILDVMMPYIDGYEVCRQIRQISDVPIIFLTSLSKEEEEIKGLELGGVDYVTKPFNPRVLVARAKAVLRQRAADHKTTPFARYTDSYLTIDLGANTVCIQDEPINLTKTEYKLLAYFIQNAGNILTFKQILEHVWGWDYQNNTQNVHVYVSRLRQKIEPKPQEPSYLLTVYGRGYRFATLPAV